MAQLSRPPALWSVALAAVGVAGAALGLGVDLRVISKVGGRVTAAVTLSLAVLVGLSIVVVHFFP
jgi:uncharacterized membrane protein YadS